MSDGISLLDRITNSISEAPISCSEEMEPSTKHLYDGYIRKSKVQTMYVTPKYRHRKAIMVAKIILVLLIISGLLFAIKELGYLSALNIFAN